MSELQTYHKWEVDGKLYRAVFDESYQVECPHGKLECDRHEDGDEKSCQEYLDEELRELEAGRLVAIGIIVSEHRKCKRKTHCEPCPKQWIEETDSLWGIVIEADLDKIEEFARESM